MTKTKTHKAGKTETGAEPDPANANPNSSSSPPPVSRPTIDPRSGAKPPRSTTKIGTVIALLSRGEGATLDEIVGATGWQKHSARAALTGLKKKGHTIVKSKRGDTTCYRITGQA